jgi:predicted CoA-binding protein
MAEGIARSLSAKGNSKVRARSMEARVVNASHSTEKWSPSSSASDIVKSIHAMLHPRNIVLVGATDKPGNYAERIWNNLVKYRYKGKLFPVNAKRETIWGVPCYKDFASLPEKPDHVLVLVPARFAVQVIRHHRHLGLQRIAGRGKPAAGGRIASGGA